MGAPPPLGGAVAVGRAAAAKRLGGLCARDSWVASPHAHVGTVAPARLLVPDRHCWMQVVCLGEA
eukprot:CAMPEP_0206257736 /NCGR_PEP_ID=MMETSP0047_2-20121206/25515_1 /ASSEMBLY_ACC=CAM_ASM_000192 /TAXON_ID=195065 /ORGANISM="Chroomonas mesostigmatica_cf, Strain CCMP1168" /LENGTH=64 /DNA_ID=CAMNT_0053684373 /DNA_START=461 /DNA_END=651 /DNA_ORIENTATION=+